MTQNLRDRIFKTGDHSGFIELALQIFDYQYNNNVVYQEFAKNLKKLPANIKSLADLPFLPVEFFRSHRVISGQRQVQRIFESSGTTGSLSGRHYLCDTGLYIDSFLNSFGYYYGDPADYMIAALLPSYTERENSSLVYMADYLIRMSKSPLSGFDPPPVQANNKMCTHHNKKASAWG